MRFSDDRKPEQGCNAKIHKYIFLKMNNTKKNLCFESKWMKWRNFISKFFKIFIFKKIINLINVGIATQLRLNCSHFQYIRRWKRFYIVLLIFAPFLNSRWWKLSQVLGSRTFSRTKLLNGIVPECHPEAWLDRRWNFLAFRGSSWDHRGWVHLPHRRLSSSAKWS